MDTEILISQELPNGQKPASTSESSTSTDTSEWFDLSRPQSRTNINRNTSTLLQTLLDEEEGPKDIPIHQLTSDHILTKDITPYSKENDLPPFRYSSRALHYYQVLRTILSKYIRSSEHLKYIKTGLENQTIPRGLRLNKPIQVIEPTSEFRLKMLEIFGRAEKDMIKNIVAHYEISIPKIRAEFDLLWRRLNRITEEEKTLITLKLIHYKNDLIKTKQTRTTVKTRRDEEEQIETEQPPQPPPTPRPNPQRNNDWPTETTSNWNPRTPAPLPQRNPRTPRNRRN